jgi:hypothetical protein
MSKIYTAAAFCGIAAFLFASRYLVAAVYASGGPTWNRELYLAALGYVGNSLWYWAALSFAVGIYFHDPLYRSTGGEAR